MSRNLPSPDHPRRVDQHRLTSESRRSRSTFAAPSAEVRSTTRGPSWRSPNCRGPSATDPRRGLRRAPKLSRTAAEGCRRIHSRNISTGAPPTAKAVSNSTDRHQSERASPLPRAIRSGQHKANARGPARTGVSRKTRDQASPTRVQSPQPTREPSSWPTGPRSCPWLSLGDPADGPGRVQTTPLLAAPTDAAGPSKPRPRGSAARHNAGRSRRTIWGR